MGREKKETSKRGFDSVMAATESRKSPPQLRGGTSLFSFTSCLASAGGFKQADLCFLPPSLAWVSKGDTKQEADVEVVAG